ncbi:MAG: hypothetical protein WA678_05820 [Rhabdochlamydiaceae bacterium]
MSVSNNTSYHSMYDNFIGMFFPSYILGSASYQGKLESVNSRLDGCAIWVNFWGTREIVSKMDDDFPIIPVSLDAVAGKIIRTTPIDINGSGETLSPNELRARQEIVGKIRTLYSTSDALAANSNFITRFFVFIREQCNPLPLFGYSDWYSDRWAIENGF